MRLNHRSVGPVRSFLTAHGSGSQAPSDSRSCPTLGLTTGVLCAVFVLAASATEQRPEPHHKAQSAGQTEFDLQERIAKEIGRADCDHHAQCRTLPVGWKECGGPAAWVAWSSKTANMERLEALAKKLAIVQRRQSVPGGGQSNCQYLPDPGAICVSGGCTLRPSAISAQ